MHFNESERHSPERHVSPTKQNHVSSLLGDVGARDIHSNTQIRLEECVNVAIIIARRHKGAPSSTRESR